MGIVHPPARKVKSLFDKNNYKKATALDRPPKMTEGQVWNALWYAFSTLKV
jgi:hypothetical protein